jgi:hypothetical protein
VVHAGARPWMNQEVRALKLKDDGKIAEELLKRVKKNDFVPKSMEGEYRKVLLEEFKLSP